MSLRILYVDTEEVWRGGQEQLYGLMAGMVTRGHEVSLATPPGSPLGARSVELNVQVTGFRQRNELDLRAWRRFREILEEKPVEVVHFNTPRPLLLGGLAARSKKVPAVVCSRRVNFPLKSRFSAWKYNHLLHSVLTVSSSIRTTLVQCGVRSDLVQVVYEGVDPASIDQLQADPLFPGQTGPLVGTVAHLSGEKGHWDLLEAVRIIAPRFPEARFLIIGSGRLERKLQKRCRELNLDDQVHFLGFREDSDALMKQLDLFCLPSLSEGLSSAILAAMASRLPVVSTKVGGIPELVVEGKTGCLVTPGAPDELAKALERLLGNPALRQQMGEAGRERIQRRFTVETKLRATEAAYTELLQL